MGFMGLGNWVEVDGAADLHHSLEDRINKLVARELKDPGNSYNPPGFVNVLLILEESPALADFINEKLLMQLGRRIRHFDYSDYRDELKSDIKRLKRFWAKRFPF